MKIYKKIEYNKFTLSAFFIIFLFAVVAFLPSFNSSFHLDDYAQIANAHLENLSFAGVFKNYPATRWLVFLSFKVNTAINGYNVFGYHLVNFLLHLISVFLIFKITELLFFFIRRNIPVATSFISPQLASIFAAAVFAVHPLQSQPVIYITQRLMLSASFCYLLALYSLARGYLPGKSKITGWLGAAAAFLIGAFCKEIIVTLPVILILMTWLFLQPPEFKSWTKKNWFLTAGISFLIIAVPVVIFMNTIKWDFNQLKSAWHSIGGALYVNTPGLTRFTYILTQTKVVLKYIGLFICPVGLQIDPDIKLCATLYSPAFILSSVSILFLLIISWLLRKASPLILWGFLFYFIVMLPQSSIIPTPDLMFEHRAYLGVAGLIWAFLGIVCLISRYIHYRNIKFFIRSFAVIIILILTLITYNRSNIWKTELSLWADAYNKSPNKSRVVNNYVNALLNNNDESNAIIILEKKLNESKSVPPFIVTTLANIYARNGKMEEAGKLYFNALKGNYKNLEARYNLALISHARGDHKNALYHAKTLWKLYPENADVYYLLGIIHAPYANEFTAATNCLSVYLKKDPKGENTASVKTLMKMLIKSKEIDK
ncbi:MAG: hypothetical protein DRI44_02345 [Chlamydiae bacterium]|nr:MAG: hypothetical protein DRI44_02345 [Chlamydiota bacterium]